jgi:nucleotide-binding universal stress UspA family protein
MFAIQTVLHPTDFSDRSGVAFHLACALARDHGARLVVLHVPEVPAVMGGTDGLIIPTPPIDWEGLRDKLHRLRPGDTKVPVEYRVAEGDTATEILRLADEVKADLIVMGTHGRRGVGRLLMGSVAEEVVRKAPCPVLTVKVPLPQVPPAGMPATEVPERAPEVVKR